MPNGEVDWASTLKSSRGSPGTCVQYKSGLSVGRRGAASGEGSSSMWQPPWRVNHRGTSDEPTDTGPRWGATEVVGTRRRIHISSIPSTIRPRSYRGKFALGGAGDAGALRAETIAACRRAEIHHLPADVGGNTGIGGDVRAANGILVENASDLRGGGLRSSGRARDRIAEPVEETAQERADKEKQQQRNDELANQEGNHSSGAEPMGSSPVYLGLLLLLGSRGGGILVAGVDGRAELGNHFLTLLRIRTVGS